MNSRHLVIFVVWLTTISALLFSLAAVSPQHTDGAEYTLNALTGSLNHPPGYPVFSLLNYYLIKIFAPANPYGFLALCSVLCFILSSILFFSSLMQLTQKFWLSLSLVTSILLFEPALSSVTDAEVFGLQYLLLAIVLKFYVSYREKSSVLILSLLGLSYGVAAAHHQTAILILPLLIFSLAGLRHLLIFSVVSGLSGLLLYTTLFLWQDSVVFPALESIGPWWETVLRKHYGTLSLTSGESAAPYSYFAVVLGLISLYFIPLLFSTLLSCYSSLKQRRGFLLIGQILTLAFIGWFCFKLQTANYERMSDAITSRFYGLVLISLLFVATAGLRFLRSLPQYFSYIFVILLLLPLSLNLQATLSAANARTDFSTDFELRYNFKTLPQNAVYLTQSDRGGMGMQYYKHFYYPDSQLIILHLPILGDPEYKKLIAKEHPLIAANLIRHHSRAELLQLLSARGQPVFSLLSNQVPDGYYQVPRGLAWQWLKQDQSFSYAVLLADLKRLCRALPQKQLSKLSEHRFVSRIIQKNVWLAPFGAAAAIGESPEIRQIRKIHAVLLKNYAGKPQDYSALCAVSQ